MYAITGATGNTGRVVAEKLLANGKQVRVIGRDTSRLAHFLQKGAEVIAATSQTQWVSRGRSTGPVLLMCWCRRTSPQRTFALIRNK